MPVTRAPVLQGNAVADSGSRIRENSGVCAAHSEVSRLRLRRTPRSSPRQCPLRRCLHGLHARIMARQIGVEYATAVYPSLRGATRATRFIAMTRTCSAIPCVIHRLQRRAKVDQTLARHWRYRVHVMQLYLCRRYFMGSATSRGA